MTARPTGSDQPEPQWRLYRRAEARSTAADEVWRPRAARGRKCRSECTAPASRWPLSHSAC